MLRNESQRLEGWTCCPDGTRLRMNVVRVTAAGVERAVLAVPDEDLVLLLQLRLAPRFACETHELAIELWRGDERRDQWRGVLKSIDFDLALAVSWSARVGVSSRLVCRAVLDSVELAQQVVLLGRPVVDAQGRMSLEAMPSASQATLLAYLDECHREVGQSPSRR